MKYQNYIKMNLLDRDEWNFRFKENTTFNFRVDLYSLVLALALNLMLMMIYILIVKDIIIVQYEALEILLLSLKITPIILFVWGFSLIGQFISHAYFKYREYQWFKEKGYK